jgi:hypothetical protein
MTPTSEQATQRITAVEKAFSEAIGEWTGVGQSIGSFFGMTSQDQTLGAIRSMQTLGFEPWKARVNRLAPTDQEGWDRWIQDGNDMLKNLAGIAQDAAASSLPGIVAETATVSVVQVADKTVAVAKAVWNAKGLLIFGVAVLVVGFIAWKVMD